MRVLARVDLRGRVLVLLAEERTPVALGDRLASFLLWLLCTLGADEHSSSPAKYSAQNEEKGEERASYY